MKDFIEEKNRQYLGVDNTHIMAKNDPFNPSNSKKLGIIKNKMLEILTDDPWNKEALTIISKIEVGRISRLYQIDAIRSDLRDTKAIIDHLVWEIKEEISIPSKINIKRLAYRFENISSMISTEYRDYDFDFINLVLGAIENLEKEKNARGVKNCIKAVLIMGEKKPEIMSQILSKNLVNTKNIILELLDDREKISDEFSYLLIRSIVKNRYLFTDINIRQHVANKIYQMGDDELAFWLAMESIKINPQDDKSAIVALNSAINIGDDEKILASSGIVLSLKKEPGGIKYEKISASSIRKGNIGYAIDLLSRRRMKLNLEGHRQRIGINYHNNNFENVKEEILRTPLPHRNHDSIKTYNTLSLLSMGFTDEAIKSIDQIEDDLEKEMMHYYCHHNSGDYVKAYWSINSHFSKRSMSLINNNWIDSKCKFLKIKNDDLRKNTKQYGKVTVIMTCHKYNDALPLAIKSIFNQTYSNIQFIFVDDFSPIEDIKKYDKLLRDKNIIRIRMKENSGTYACRNAGLKRTEGEYVTFADSDDWVHPEKISNSIEVMVNKNADLVCGRYIRMGFDGAIKWNGIRFARFALMGMTFRTNILKDRLNGFDERVRHSADSELFERAKKILGKKRVIRYPRIEIIALDSGSNLTSKGELAIGWLGATGERVKYSSSYRKKHTQLDRKSNSFNGEFFKFSFNNQNLTENEALLREEFQYEIKNKNVNNKKTSTLEDDVLVTMCTYPGGFPTLATALKSILYNQSMHVTKLRLTVNGEESPINLPDDDRLEVIMSEQDVTDKGKFIQIKNHLGYVVTVDDDIEYPSNYIEEMIKHIEKFSRNCLIGVHGAHIPEGPPITRWWEYMNLRRSHVFIQEMATYVPVNVIGTGTLAFHTSIGQIKGEEFDYQRMVDLHVAVWAQRNNIPMLICPRRRDWLKEISSGYVGKIWNTVKEDYALQHRMLEVLQRQQFWQLHYAEGWNEPGSRLLDYDVIKWKNRELCQGMVLPENVNRWSMVSNNPLVTIYMPAYNCQDYIVESVKSALNQTYKNIEICIHDDGSNDDTLAVLKKSFRFNRKVKITSSENGGISHASNSAISRGRGELILQLDSDDILHPTALEKLVKEIGNDIICSYGTFDRINKIGEKIDEGWNWPYYSHSRLMRSMIIHHPRLFRRDAWELVGGFNENLVNAVDYDFFLRLAEIGDMRHINEKLYSYRIHESSTSQDKYEIQTRNTYLVQRYALKRLGLDNYVNYAPNPKFPRRVHYITKAFRENTNIPK